MSPVPFQSLCVHTSEPLQRSSPQAEGRVGRLGGPTREGLRPLPHGLQRRSVQTVTLSTRFLRFNFKRKNRVSCVGST